MRYGAFKDKWLYQYMLSQLDVRLNHLYFLRIFEDHIHVEIPHSRGVIMIDTPRKRLYSRTTHLVIIWTALSALLLFIVASLFMRNQIRPISRLANAAESFGRGMEINFRPEGATEVRKAGLAFMIMRDRLKRHIQERTEMLAGVSHDLRTPLARMKLQLAMMPKTDDTTDLQHDVDDMQSMVQGFLDFAKGVGQEELSAVRANDLLRAVVNKVRHLPLKVTLTGELDLEIHIKQELFKRCLTNLLLNANRYASELTLNVQTDSRYVKFTLDDNGPGIPVNERENVFRPFYRVDSSRNLDSGSVGLGLSIAKDIVSGHGGDMTLDESPSKGLRVIIKIPY